MMMTAKLVGLPFLGGAAAAGITATSYQGAPLLERDILFVGVGVIVALLILAVVIALAAGKIRQQVTAHERRLWVIEDRGSPALGKFAALLERECAASEEVLRRVEGLGQAQARVEQRLVRVETLLKVSTGASTEPMSGI